MIRPRWAMPPSLIFGLLGYCVLMMWSPESLLHFVLEGQYRTKISDVES